MRRRCTGRGKRDAHRQKNPEQGYETDGPSHQVSILTDVWCQTEGSTGLIARGLRPAPRATPRNTVRFRGQRGLPDAPGAARGAAAPCGDGEQPRPRPRRRRVRPAENPALSRYSSPTAWDDCALRIATLGDVVLDVVVLLEERLVSGGDVRASNRVGAGGQAANVAAWAAELGAEARCIAKRGDDPAGELVARELAPCGVELVGPIAEGATGVVVSVVQGGDRSLASDRGIAPSLAPEELDAAWVACDVLHISGYALLREPITATALLAARLA